MSVITRVGLCRRNAARASLPSCVTTTRKSCPSRMRLRYAACVELSSAIKISTRLRDDVVVIIYWRELPIPNFNPAWEMADLPADREVLGGRLHAFSVLSKIQQVLGQQIECYVPVCLN